MMGGNGDYHKHEIIWGFTCGKDRSLFPLVNPML